jgi:hypothetical protein
VHQHSIPHEANNGDAVDGGHSLNADFNPVTFESGRPARQNDIRLFQANAVMQPEMLLVKRRSH